MDPNCTAQRHGDSNAYKTHGCRCPEARQAVAAREARYVKLRYLNRGPLLINATGIHRRIRALQAIGWPISEISVRVGYTVRGLQPLLHRDQCRQDIAQKIRAVYDELSMRPGPSQSARIRAAAKGWPPPLAWEDDTIDDPAVRPVGIRPALHIGHSDVDWAVVERLTLGSHRGRCTRAERLAAIVRLHRQGLTFREIAEKVRRDIRVVTRDIAELGLTRRDAA